jgi:surfeit locus 1 family protein
VSPARRVFAPTLGFTLLTLALTVLFVALGWWQWRRGQAGDLAQQRFAAGGARLLTLAGPAESPPLFQRVAVSGRLDGTRQFLLDNRSHAGAPGYEVLTPLERRDNATLLVDRGWVPFSGSRARLPQITLDAPDPVTVSGRLGTLPSVGLASGRAAPDARAPWPKVTSFPQMPQLASALGEPLASRVLLLDPQAPFGYVRDWQAPGLPPLRHYSYAVQWWSFAALALGAWALLSRRAPPAEAA